MCVLIYAVLILLAWLYSDALIQTLALSTTSEQGAELVIAVGWEMVPSLWPLFLFAMILSSAATLFVTRRRNCSGETRGRESS